MFNDINENDAPNLAKQRIKGTDIDEVLYADDTICFTQTQAGMNKLLRAIETDGENIDSN